MLPPQTPAGPPAGASSLPQPSGTTYTSCC
jgi:hypothetical protein